MAVIDQSDRVAASIRWIHDPGEATRQHVGVRDRPRAVITQNDEEAAAALDKLFDAAACGRRPASLRITTLLLSKLDGATRFAATTST